MPSCWLLCGCCRHKDVEDVRELDYSHCSLTVVPSDVFQFERTLEELSLNSNQITQLPKVLFCCHELRKFNASDNELVTIPDAVRNLVNLEEMDISKNAILNLPDSMKGCLQLSILEASVNPLGCLPETLCQLVNMTELYLNDTFLTSLPGAFGRLSQLTVLELRENHLRSLPKSMECLSLLQRLDLGCNEFAELPEVITQLMSLQELWIDQNSIQFLPKELRNLTKLTFLDACKNRLRWLPVELDKCVSLSDLHLSMNLLTQLPESIGRLTNLTTLQVNDNKLTSLPVSVGGLSSLSELHISTNDLDKLPPSIGLLRHLRTLYADENYLIEVPPEIGSCSTITVLSLRGNNLKFIPEEIGRITCLRVLNLSGNQLRHLPYSLTKLKQLQALWLADNQTKPLIRLQVEKDQVSGLKVLTCYLLPQKPYDSANEDWDTPLGPVLPVRRNVIHFQSEAERPVRYSIVPETTGSTVNLDRALTQLAQAATRRRDAFEKVGTEQKRDNEHVSRRESSYNEDGLSLTSQVLIMERHHLLRADREKLLRDKVRMSVTSMSASITAFRRQTGLPSKPGHSVSRTSSMLDDDEPHTAKLKSAMKFKRDNSDNVKSTASKAFVELGSRNCNTNSLSNRMSYAAFMQGLDEGAPSPLDPSHNTSSWPRGHLRGCRQTRPTSRGYESDSAYQNETGYRSDVGYRSDTGCNRGSGYRSDPGWQRSLPVHRGSGGGCYVSERDVRKKEWQGDFHPSLRCRGRRDERNNCEASGPDTQAGCSNSKSSSSYRNIPMAKRTTIRNDEMYEQYPSAAAAVATPTEPCVFNGSRDDDMVATGAYADRRGGHPLRGRNTTGSYHSERSPEHPHGFHGNHSMGDNQLRHHSSVHSMTSEHEDGVAMGTTCRMTDEYKARQLASSGPVQSVTELRQSASELHGSVEHWGSRRRDSAGYNASHSVTQTIREEQLGEGDDDDEWRSQLYAASVRLQKSPASETAAQMVEGVTSRHTRDHAMSSSHPSIPALVPPSYRPTPPYCPPRDERTEFSHPTPDGATEQRLTWSAPPRPGTLLLHAARPAASRRLYNGPDHNRDASRSDVMYCTNAGVDVLPPERQYNSSGQVLPAGDVSPLRLTQYEQDVAVSSSTDSGYGQGHCFNQTPGTDPRFSGSPHGIMGSPYPGSSLANSPYQSPRHHEPPPTAASAGGHLQESPLDGQTQRHRVTISKNPGLGFSIAGGMESQGNPYRPDDNGIFVTKVLEEGPALGSLVAGDKIIQVNGIDFRSINHSDAVEVLRNSPQQVALLIERS